MPYQYEKWNSGIVLMGSQLIANLIFVEQTLIPYQPLHTLTYSRTPVMVMKSWKARGRQPHIQGSFLMQQEDLLISPILFVIGRQLYVEGPDDFAEDQLHLCPC